MSARTRRAGDAEHAAGSAAGRRVHPEIARSWTLPSTVYTDADSFAAQRERVFARSWQYLADADRVRAPGHVLPLTLLDGCLDEPLLLAVGDDGETRCLSNVCTHRGALVVEGEGHLKTMRCRYHGRRFRLDGAFVSMPEFEDVREFPAPCDDLPQLPLERFGPLLFTAAVDPGLGFDDWIGPVRRRIDWLPLERAQLDPHSSRDYHLRAHWALYVDNYLEEFHIPYVHRDSLAGLDYESYRTELFDHGNLQYGMARAGEPTFDLPQEHPDAGQPVAAFYFWLFPNLMINVYPWGISLNVVRPVARDRTVVSFRSYVWDDSKRTEGLGADLHRVEMEDEEVVESVQRGVRSRLYDRGRFSPRREVGTHQFHRLLASELGLEA